MVLDPELWFYRSLRPAAGSGQRWDIPEARFPRQKPFTRGYIHPSCHPWWGGSFKGFQPPDPDGDDMGAGAM